MKIILWAVLIIFLIGLLVVTGVFKMIFQKSDMAYKLSGQELDILCT
ncbi:TPA: protein YohP [Escherichia coli]|nr:protein YohP [Escherichia coli]